MIIRELLKSDGEKLGSFLESLSPQTEYFFHPYPLTRDSALAFVNREDIFCLVAEENGKIIGYAWWEPKDVELPSIGICVADEYQGRGVGKALLGKLVQEAEKRKKRGLRLITMKDNLRAIALYKKFGFYIVGETKEDPRGESWKMIKRIGPIRKIFIVPYCHPDWAWTHTRLWHERRYDLVFNEVLDIISQHPNFRWYMDNYLCQLTPFLKRSPKRIKELRERIKEGKIAICGGYSNIRPNMVEEETYIRNLIIGKEKFRSLFPEANLSAHGDAVDVAVGHPQMPQVLSLAGYRYFIFWRPEVALNHKEIPYEFIWEGLDGSRIIAHRACYGGLCTKDMLPDDFRDRWEEIKALWWEREIGYRAVLSPTGLIWISHGNDDARPLRALWTDEEMELLAFVEEWNKRENIPMVFATPLEFFKEINKEELPIVRGSLDPCDVCYNAAFGGSLGLWKLRIETDKELRLGEIWSAIAKALGYSWEANCFQPLWENLLNYSAHATQWLFQEDFDNLYSLAQQTIGKAKGIKIKALKDISNHISPKEKEVIVAFNPLPWERRIYIPMVLSFPQKIPPFIRLKDGTGREIAYQRIREVGLSGWELEVLTRVFLPPLGYNTITVETEKPKDLEEGSFLQPIWQGGEIIGFREEEIGEVKLEKGDVGFGGLVLFLVDVTAELHMGRILDKRKVEWDAVEKVNDGPLFKSFLRRGKVNSHKIEQKIHLYSGEKRIEFETLIDWRGEDGFIALVNPLPFEGELYGDTPFAVERKDLSEEIYGPVEGSGGNIERWRKGAFFVRSFIDWSDSQKGIAYISHDGDRYFIFDEEDRAIYHILINSIITCEGWEKDINYQRKGVGLHHFKGSILLHKGDWREGKVYKQALLLRHPPDLIFMDGEEKESLSPILPPIFSFLSLEPENLVLTAFYFHEGDYYLRFYEIEGKSTEAKVKLPFKIKEAIAVDFLGNFLKGPEIEIKGNELSLKVEPWKIITLRLNPTAFSL
ncbi:GNAT family N-acetyltransferase [bacterium]|nr:GNAT family N-acetyltransferase [bacterium]